ncbi:MAG: DUF58 domain-containing protein, partial [Pseudomonadales bacterium]|nr:DUF58 domain-containing protein [Pseudomonadales bacterium]
PGDSLRSVAWKTYAKSDQLASKQFVDYIDNRLWLNWDAAHGNDEQRLAQLCHWALLAEGGHHEYGLQLPDERLAPARGRAHLEALLTLLAMYRLPRAQTAILESDATGARDAAELQAAAEPS